MKPIRLIAPVLALALLVGCAHISRTERNTLVAHNVNPAVYDRMVRGDILTLSDIIELSQRNVPPQLIINYLYSTRAIYVLDKPALTRLNQARVSQELIGYLSQTESMFGPRVYSPRYYGPAPYYYDPYYPWRPYPYYYGPSGVVVIRGGGHWHH